MICKLMFLIYFSRHYLSVVKCTATVLRYRVSSTYIDYAYSMMKVETIKSRRLGIE